MELVEGSTTDFQVYEKTESNYTAMLHWYDSQGAHRKLDIRKAVRKSLKKVCLVMMIGLHECVRGGRGKGEGGEGRGGRRRGRRRRGEGEGEGEGGGGGEEGGGEGGGGSEGERVREGEQRKKRRGKIQ